MKLETLRAKRASVVCFSGSTICNTISKTLSKAVVGSDILLSVVSWRQVRERERRSQVHKVVVSLYYYN